MSPSPALLTLLVVSLVACQDAKTYDPDGDGYTLSVDCDSEDPEVHPDAVERCDGIDNDCDGLLDEADDDLSDGVPVYTDADRDGHGDDEIPPTVVCTPASGDATVAGDCDDTDPLINEDANERCNGLDDNCNDTADDEDPLKSGWWTDADQDGFGDEDEYFEACTQDSWGAVNDDTDCDDQQRQVNPRAEDLCNGQDDDCDEDIDETADGSPAAYQDADGDGYGDPDVSTDDCPPGGLPDGWVADGTDCDDQDASVHPGADEADCTDPNDYNCDGSVGYADGDGDGVPACRDCDDDDAQSYPDADEICDGVDNDCDALSDDADDDVDAESASTWYLDADEDTYGDPSLSREACVQPEGYTADDEDCLDSDAEIHPAASEICDELDNDCDGAVDDDDDSLDTTTGTVWYADADGDGFGDEGTAVEACEQPDGHVVDHADCNDGSAEYNPLAAEACDDPTDYNCDGSVAYEDVDGDGAAACDDCDDGDADLYPGAPETVGDQIDQDCDGAEVCYIDADGDGFADSAATVNSADTDCGDLPEVPHTTPQTDCDDSDASVNPDAAEICDDEEPAVDEDCNGATDDADRYVDTDTFQTWFLDHDGDGYGDPSSISYTCDQPAGYVLDDTDCDDDDGYAYPDASEVVGDEADQDCDGAERCYVDLDDDGYADPSGAEIASADLGCTDSGEAGATVPQTDCDESDPAISPGATEICDGIDNDCDADLDDDDASLDASTGTTWYADDDGDGYGDPLDTTQTCEIVDGYLSDDSDCDGADAGISPDGLEICDGLDNDCDGLADDADADVDLDTATIWYADDDGDGYGALDAATVACDAPGTAYASVSGDAVDDDATVYPGTQEDRVFFQDTSGVWTELTGTYTFDDALNPAQITLTTGGVLQFGAGTFYVHLSDTTNIGNMTTIRGVGAAETTLDGAELDRVLYWSGAGTVEIRDLAITHGLSASGPGGGIYFYGAALTLRDCDLRDNTASSYGGGLFIHYTGPRLGTLLEIDGCEISSNRGYTGAVQASMGGTTKPEVVISTSWFEGNQGWDGSGGIALGYSDQGLLVEDTVFSGNTGTYSGAILGYTGAWTLTNVDLADNTATYGGAIYHGGDITLTCDGTGEVATDDAITGNSDSYGAVYLKTGGTFTTSGCDWGTGATDNSPADVYLQATGGTYSTDASAASFACDDAGCE